MILKISLWLKAGVPRPLVKQRLCLHLLYFPQNTLMLTEFRGEFSDLHSIFRPCALLRKCKETLRDHATTAELKAGCTLAIFMARVVFHKKNYGSDNV